ncbi:phage major capsid protein [Herbiconiux sp. VKM Ac-2851]|uniref:phage major capsid protein n=1 Tax=Herbiconiux sp. VKM Ac-2851 TaxID=2739025 RepID=UPI0015641C7F|nr:phage major capsid protein [Herbiconiux sp. VKM Ac-2851]NQX36256.1 phage major capsid protein [Herbiconiux sp. VKM Ac-2851]
MDRLIAEAEQALAALRNQRAAAHTERRTMAEGLAPDASFTEAQQARFAELSTNVRGFDSQITTAEHALEDLRAAQSDEARLTAGAADITATDAAARGAGPAVVTREPRTYTEETSRSGVSFFSDAYRAQYKSDYRAKDRIEKHMREMEVEQREERAIGSNQVGGLVIPQYLTDLLVLPTRKGRVTANQVTNLELPERGTVLGIPRWTSGTTVTSQDGENTDVSETDIVANTDLLVPVRTIAGEQGVSRQTLERGEAGIDSIVYADLVEAYHAQIGFQTINGTGSNNQHLGIRNTAGIPQASAFGAALTAALFYKKIAGAIASVSSGERAANEAPLEANLIVMHPRRWGWLTSLVDSDGRPLVNTVYNGPANVIGMNLNPGAQSLTAEANGDRVVGQIHGLPVVTDANIPTTIGTLNEDIVLVMDKAKSLLWEEGDGAPRELQFEQTRATKLQVLLQVYGYSAFTAGRRTQATAIVGGVDTVAGNGLVAPALF